MLNMLKHSNGGEFTPLNQDLSESFPSPSRTLPERFSDFDRHVTFIVT